MGLRFRKSVKILPGVKINFNKKSTSVTIGGRGAKYTISSTGQMSLYSKSNRKLTHQKPIKFAVS